jgi:uncharacterized protein (TIGR02466 family)
MTTLAFFPTPVYSEQIASDKFEAVQEELLAAIEKIKKNNLFQKRPDWNSHTISISDLTFRQNIINDYSLLLFKEQVELHIMHYMQEIQAPSHRVFKDKIKIHSAWFTQTKKDEHSPDHTHGECDLSGVYYIKTNNRDGSIYFNTPVPIIKSSYCFFHIPERNTITPAEGTMLLFPGWLEHGVLSNKTDSERLSISFNIMFERDSLFYNDN